MARICLRFRQSRAPRRPAASRLRAVFPWGRRSLRNRDRLAVEATGRRIKDAKLFAGAGQAFFDRQRFAAQQTSRLVGYGVGPTVEGDRPPSPTGFATVDDCARTGGTKLDAPMIRTAARRTQPNSPKRHETCRLFKALPKAILPTVADLRHKTRLNLTIAWRCQPSPNGAGVQSAFGCNRHRFSPLQPQAEEKSIRGIVRIRQRAQQPFVRIAGA